MPAPTSLPERLELQQRMYLLPRAQRLIFWAALAVVLLVFVAMVALLLIKGAHSGKDPATLWDALLAKLARDPVDAVFNILIACLAILHPLYLVRARRHERLILTRTGIEYRSPLPAALQFLQRSWSLNWGQIRAVTLKGTALGHGPFGAVLALDAGARKVKLYPAPWVNPATYRPVSPWQELRKQQRMNAEDLIAAVAESEVVRYVTAALPHLSIRRDLDLPIAFALEKNPRSLAIVIAFFVLLLYALGDTFFLNPETYVETPSFDIFLASGALAAFAAALWMRRGKVPLAEGVIVALLFGATFAAATYPGALRLNAITDTEGLRTHQYQLTPARTFQPLTEGLPTLSFPRDHDYWNQFKAGSIHEFELRKGGLGFYQINMQPVHEAMREYYKNRDSGTRPTRK